MSRESRHYLFEQGRLWSYEAVRVHREAGGGAEAWGQAVHAQVARLNDEIPDPVSESNVRYIANKVAGWTWEKFTLEKYPTAAEIERERLNALVAKALQARSS